MQSKSIVRYNEQWKPGPDCFSMMDRAVMNSLENFWRLKYLENVDEFHKNVTGKSFHKCQIPNLLQVLRATI